MRTWRKNSQRGVRIADCVVCGLTIWSNQRSEIVKALPLELKHAESSCVQERTSVVR